MTSLGRYLFLPDSSYRSAFMDDGMDERPSDPEIDPPNVVDPAQSFSIEEDNFFKDCPAEWTPPSYDHLLQSEATCAWVVLDESDMPQCCSSSKELVLVRPKTGYHLPITSPSPSPTSSLDYVTEVESHAATASLRIQEDGDTKSENEAKSEPLNATPELRVTVRLPKRCIAPQTTARATPMFSGLTVKTADSDDDGADSDYEEPPVKGRKRRAAAPKHARPATKAAASKPRNLTSMSTPCAIRITRNGAIWYRCPARGCQHTLETASGITRHYQSNHLRRTGKCKLCPAVFKNDRNHVRQRHLENACAGEKVERLRCLKAMGIVLKIEALK